jgi:ABC-2 type transport system permease protein
MNIYKHEFRMMFRSVFSWSLSVALVILLYMTFFSSFSENAALLNETLAQFPPELLIAFGMTDVDMSTVLGYFSFIFIFVQIILAIQAASYGFSILSVEERELTADFLLAKPVGRSSILTSKLLAALTGLVITALVVWISSFAFISLFRDQKPYDANTLVLLLVSVSLFQLVFFSLAMVISVMIKRIRSVTPYAMGLAFGMYVLSVFGDMLGENSLELITPFKHFDPNYIIRNLAFDPKILISLVVIAISIAGSYLLYQRRNIPAPI